MHLNAKRKQLYLTQTEVAERLEVSVHTYKAWEADEGVPQITRIPGIVRFLGFSPYDPTLSFRDKLVVWRSVNGVSQERLAAMMQVDVSTVAKWERGDTRPYPIRSPRLFTAMVLLGDLGYRLFTGEKTSSDWHHSIQNRRAIRGPKVTVGTVTIQFPPSLYVFYENAWAIGRKIEAWRTSLGLSQRDFAKLTGFAYQSICRWETGRRTPSTAHVTHIISVMSEILAHIR
jgi:DNA-binding transcriptional regulator YiaG